MLEERYSGMFKGAVAVGSGQLICEGSEGSGNKILDREEREGVTCV